METPLFKIEQISITAQHRNSQNVCTQMHGNFISSPEKRQCLIYMFVSEICITLSKKDGQWVQGEGCAYKPITNPSNFKKWETDFNNTVVWEKITIDVTRPLEMFFPMNWPPISVKLRMDSDPLLYALPKHFNFGPSFKEKFTVACIVMGLSLFVGCILHWRYQ
jgi:hypothetical protein